MVEGMKRWVNWDPRQDNKWLDLSAQFPSEEIFGLLVIKPKIRIRTGTIPQTRSLNQEAHRLQSWQFDTFLAFLWISPPLPVNAGLVLGKCPLWRTPRFHSGTLRLSLTHSVGRRGLPATASITLIYLLFSFRSRIVIIKSRSSSSSSAASSAAWPGRVANEWNRIPPRHHIGNSITLMSSCGLIPTDDPAN